MRTLFLLLEKLSFPKEKLQLSKPVLIILFCIMLVVLLTLPNGVYAKSQTSFDLSGYAVAVGGERYDSESLIFGETFDNKYRVGLILQLRLDCPAKKYCKRGESDRANQALFIQRVVKKGDFEMGIGMSYWHNQTPAWNSNTPYVLSVRYQIFENTHVGYTHFSTGGSSSNNGGMDLLTIGYTFR